MFSIVLHCIVLMLVSFIKFAMSSFACQYCKKVQKSYIINNLNYNKFKQCSDNIDGSFMLQCNPRYISNNYTLQMMIDEFSIKSEQINGSTISAWFNNNKQEMLNDINYCHTIMNSIENMYKKISNNIALKINKLNTLISHKCINEYILHAPLRQLEIYTNFIQCVIKMHSPTNLIHEKTGMKHCILCERDYPIEILFCEQYCQFIEWYNIICCFCIHKSNCDFEQQGDISTKINTFVHKKTYSDNNVYLC